MGRTSAEGVPGQRAGNIHWSEKPSPGYSALRLVPTAKLRHGGGWSLLQAAPPTSQPAPQTVSDSWLRLCWCWEVCWELCLVTGGIPQLPPDRKSTRYFYEVIDVSPNHRPGRGARVGVSWPECPSPALS